MPVTVPHELRAAEVCEPELVVRNLSQHHSACHGSSTPRHRLLLTSDRMPSRGSGFEKSSLCASCPAMCWTVPLYGAAMPCRRPSMTISTFRKSTSSDATRVKLRQVDCWPGWMSLFSATRSSKYQCRARIPRQAYNRLPEVAAPASSNLASPRSPIDGRINRHQTAGWISSMETLI